MTPLQKDDGVRNLCGGRAVVKCEDDVRLHSFTCATPGFGRSHMASRLIRGIKLTFVLCCIGGLLGITMRRTDFSAEALIIPKCHSNVTVFLECRDQPPALLQCDCSDRACLSGSDQVAVRDSRTSLICDCPDGNGTLRAMCNGTDGLSCVVGEEPASQKTCSATPLWQSAIDLEEAERRCLDLPCEQWSEWTNCTSTCGGGTRQRSHQCPVFDQGQCRLRLTPDIAICNTAPCPSWGDWSQWSACTSTCNAGQPGSRTRTRSCPSPDACGNGPTFQTEPCSSNVTCPAWTEWEKWGACSRTCGRGDRTRKRRCEPSSDDSCLGSGVQMEPCFDGPCPFVAHWSAWSPCTATCGGGLKTRTKLSCSQGPPQCPLLNEQDKCNEQACPQWSNWEPWMECSRTCGGGQRVRKRKCPIDHGCVGRTMHLDKIRCNNFECPTASVPSSTVSSLPLS